MKFGCSATANGIILAPRLLAIKTVFADRRKRTVRDSRVRACVAQRTWGQRSGSIVVARDCSRRWHGRRELEGIQGQRGYRLSFIHIECVGQKRFDRIRIVCSGDGAIHR